MSVVCARVHAVGKEGSATGSHSWVRVLYRGSQQGSSNTTGRTGKGSAAGTKGGGGDGQKGDGSNSGTAGRVRQMLQVAGQEAHLLYSNAPFGQEEHRCPFDFSQPVPASGDGTPLTYAECLAHHGRPINEGYNFR